MTSSGPTNAHQPTAIRQASTERFDLIVVGAAMRAAKRLSPPPAWG